MIQAIINWLPKHFLISAISILIYVISARTRKERRQPSVAMLWVFGFLFIPYIILPIYIVFGQRKKKLHVEPPQHMPPTTDLSHWAVKVVKSFKLPGASTCDINFHKDGKEALDGLYRVINSAKKTLDIEIFIFKNDKFSNELMNKIYMVQEKGIQVRIMIDAFGSFLTPNRFFKKFINLGGKFCRFRPIIYLKYNGPLNLRNHRKLIVADSTYLWCGGRNLSKKYFLDDDDDAWLDMSFDLKGAIAMSASYQFEVDWADTNQVQTNYNYPDDNILDIKSSSLAQFLPTGPDQVEDTANSLLINAIYRTEKEFIIVSPYFIPSVDMIDALRLAARRGVNVTIFIPEKSDHKIADFVRERIIRDLANHEVNIKLIKKMCHAKIYISDDNFAMSGSINADQRSLFINYENAVIFYSKEDILWMKNWINKLKCKDYIPKKVGFFRDISEGMCLSIGYQL